MRHSLYQKLTGVNYVLEARSMHPGYTKCNILRSQGMQLACTCQETQDFLIKLQDLEQDFQLRGYDDTTIEGLFEPIRELEALSDPSLTDPPRRSNRGRGRNYSFQEQPRMESMALTFNLDSKLHQEHH